jgi:hypothetical protein
MKVYIGKYKLMSFGGKNMKRGNKKKGKMQDKKEERGKKKVKRVPKKG